MPRPPLNCLSIQGIQFRRIRSHPVTSSRAGSSSSSIPGGTCTRLAFSGPILTDSYSGKPAVVLFQGNKKGPNCPRPKGQFTHLRCSLRTGSGDRAPARRMRENRVRPHTPTVAGDLRDRAHSPPAETEQKQEGWEAGHFRSSLSGKSFKLEKYSSLSLRKLKFLLSLKA